MFATLLIVLFSYSILKNEIQCAVIVRENFNGDSADLTKNLTSLKKPENFEHQDKFVPPFLVNNKTVSDDKSIDLNGEDISEFTPLKEENEILISSRKNLSETNGRGRQPKFFGSLAFLAGLGAGGLATAASDNANTIVKLLNGPLTVPFGFSRYFAGFYGPPPYLPVSYPVLYPVPSIANNYPNFVSSIPVIPSPIPITIPVPARQNTPNNTAGVSRQNSDYNPGEDSKDNKQSNYRKPFESQEAAATQTEMKRTAAPKINDDIVENVVSPVVSEESELRQILNALKTTTTTTTTTTTPQPTSTTTTNSTMMNSTEGSNGTVVPTPATNTSGQFPLNSYYGGSPQGVDNVVFTTEDPKQRYLKDYSAEAYALPFERPAVFNPYQNVDEYPSPFVNSFSAGEPYPEFLNTVESDRYIYDSKNHRNYNGFRPILK